MLVEGVFLRHITDVTFERLEIRVKRLSVEDGLAAGRLKLTGQHFEQRAFS
jgi:hypothetical protein